MSTSLPQNGFGWMILPLRRYAEFRGRSGRREFWAYSAFLALGYLAILGASLIASEDLVGFALLGGWSLFFIVNFVPGLALTIRRLHDMNLSGALLIAIFAGLSILSIIGWLAYMVWMSLPGQRIENRHGPPIGSPDIAKVFS
jgi:uncharacterized membrane protein YhaH (DUF805 family)